MERFIIKGQNKLSGEIEVRGAKNAALKVLAASILTDKQWQIKNVPEIEDIRRMIEILKDLGVSAENPSSGNYELCASKISKTELDDNLTRPLRASIMLVGPILARHGKVTFSHPGGCAIGRRPIDIFLEGYKALGAEVKERGRRTYNISAKKLKGNTFVFRIISVTATESMILTAVLAKGKTILKNAACEPEIVSLADFLNRCGARINGAGTPVIEIEGVESLGAGKYFTIPDRIEAGTFAIMAAALKSRIKIKNCDPSHLDVLWLMLNNVGVELEIGKGYVVVNSPRGRLKAVNLTTHEYPGFATDLQAPFAVFLTQAKGSSLVHEAVYEGRLFYTDILNTMGANIIMCDPHRVIVNGPTKLYGKKVSSPDLRAGMALIIAALIAKGETIIDNIYQIDRGYEKIEERLRELGADIKRFV